MPHSLNASSRFVPVCMTICSCQVLTRRDQLMLKDDIREQKRLEKEEKQAAKQAVASPARAGRGRGRGKGKGKGRGRGKAKNQAELADVGPDAFACEPSSGSKRKAEDVVESGASEAGKRRAKTKASEMAKAAEASAPKPKAKGKPKAKPQKKQADHAPEAHHASEAAPEAHQTSEAAPEAHHASETAPEAHHASQAALEAHGASEAAHAPEAHHASPVPKAKAKGKAKAAPKAKGKAKAKAKAKGRARRGSLPPPMPASAEERLRYHKIMNVAANAIQKCHNMPFGMLKETLLSNRSTNSMFDLNIYWTRTTAGLKYTHEPGKPQVVNIKFHGRPEIGANWNVCMIAAFVAAHELDSGLQTGSASFLGAQTDLIFVNTPPCNVLDNSTPVQAQMILDMFMDNPAIMEHHRDEGSEFQRVSQLVREGCQAAVDDALDGLAN